VGDHALREVAVALQGALRPYDLCVRYAGDEFIVVLADCSREAADAKRRELQALIAEIQVDVRAGKRLRLGVSAGAAVFPHDGSTYEELLAGADHLMYRDKAARRGPVTPPSAPDPDFNATELFDAAVPVRPTAPIPQTLA
jgi:diguanylate cyclase (GGDEF)-like protein